MGKTDRAAVDPAAEPKTSRKAAGQPGRRPSSADIDAFLRGAHHRLYEVLGAHPAPAGEGTSFTVWAPNAESVSVIGDFNGWSADAAPLKPVNRSGLWSGFVKRVAPGAVYKYHLESRVDGHTVDKADPFARAAETPPSTASIVWDLDYTWGDAAWIERRPGLAPADGPMSIYELHLGSWKRDAEGAWLGYGRLADELVPYLQRMGFTHVEFLPPMEHPFFGSWGYQATGFFAPTGRYGTPQELMRLIDRLHQAGIGVILDWVPSHFPNDEHGLAFFDGTYLYEHPDPRVGYHPDWNSHIFNYERNEVRSFLLSSALFWLEFYHADGLRVDAVASMLLRDYSRGPDDWVPNKHGGRENLEAVSLLRELNQAVHENYPGVRTIAEESTAWPMVSRPVYLGGLGFDMKWDMGWMHDTLEYLKLDPIYRKYHHDKLTFRMLYAFAENFVLALSHDEVVHGKSSLVGKMFGDHWNKLAHLRALYGYMFGQPGKKLLFMGGELAQWKEWDHDGALEWELLRYPAHHGMQQLVADLNTLYREEPALYQTDFDGRGFAWVDCHDADQSVISFLRYDAARSESILVVCNFTPVVREQYRVGVPRAGAWSELINTDAEPYGGSGQGNMGRLHSVSLPAHGHPYSLCLTLPPLATLFLKLSAAESVAPGAVIDR